MKHLPWKNFRNGILNMNCRSRKNRKITAGKDLEVAGGPVDQEAPDQIEGLKEDLRQDQNGQKIDQKADRKADRKTDQKTEQKTRQSVERKPPILK
jgi:hypothetical protein